METGDLIPVSDEELESFLSYTHDTEVARRMMMEGAHWLEQIRLARNNFVRQAHPELADRNFLLDFQRKVIVVRPHVVERTEYNTSNSVIVAKIINAE